MSLFASAIPATENFRGNPEAVDVAFTRWRQLSAFLLNPSRSDRTPLVPSEDASTHQAQRLAETLNVFLEPFVTGDRDDRYEQENHLREVIVECATFGRSVSRSERPPNLGGSISGQTTISSNHVMDREASIASPKDIHSTTVQQWTAISTVPWSYQEFQLQEATVQGNVSSKFSGDSSSRYYNTQDVRRATLFNEPPPDIQDQVKSVAGHNTGLRALFRQPTRLGSRTESYFDRSQSRPGSSDSTNPSPQTFLSITPSTSCSSLRSELTINIIPDNSDLKPSQVQATHAQPHPMSSQSKSVIEPANSLSTRSDRDAQRMRELSHRIALAQVFMYQARMSDRPLKSS
ncbi:hypothetical protein Daesc_008122 [Daldinia eschscholtzii]|uniref:Uncharacterized protein n=1 Tax=Daldinia eschscholtzii TaxID=292717 RepID=A0AAX6MC85_9PEZI